MWISYREIDRRNSCFMAACQSNQSSGLNAGRTAERWVMEDSALAYMAGFFDGEGSVLLCKEKTGYWLVVSIGQVDPRPLQFIADRFGGKVKLTNSWKKRNNAKPFHHWVIKHKRAERFLLAILPYLILKKEQAEIGLSFRATIGNGGAISNDIHEDRKGMAARIVELRV